MMPSTSLAFGERGCLASSVPRDFRSATTYIGQEKSGAQFECHHDERRAAVVQNTMQRLTLLLPFKATTVSSVLVALKTSAVCWDRKSLFRGPTSYLHRETRWTCCPPQKRPISSGVLLARSIGDRWIFCASMDRRYTSRHNSRRFRSLNTFFP